MSRKPPLELPWTAAPNLHIGGWGVYPEGEVLGEGYEVADFTDEATAKHIADLHNADLARVTPRDGESFHAYWQRFFRRTGE